MKKAIFFDRDGTIIEDIPYINNTEYSTLIEGVVPSLKLFQRMGFLLVMISNQSGIGKGFITHEQFEEVHKKVISMLKKEDIFLDDFYYCPHKDEDNCTCRKPSPEMIINTSKKLNINLTNSFMIGDKLTDIETGKNAGCKTVLLNNKPEYTISIKPNFVAKNWWEIENYIWWVVNDR